MRGIVPAGTFHEHAMDEATIIRRLRDRGRSSIVAYLEVVAELIDSDLVFTSIVLKRAREEGLREEEARDPEGGRRSLINPLGQEADPLVKIIDPGGQWLEGEEADDGLPFNRHLVVV